MFGKIKETYNKSKIIGEKNPKAIDSINLDSIGIEVYNHAGCVGTKFNEQIGKFNDDDSYVRAIHNIIEKRNRPYLSNFHNNIANNGNYRLELKKEDVNPELLDDSEYQQLNRGIKEIEVGSLIDTMFYQGFKELQVHASGKVFLNNAPALLEDVLISPKEDEKKENAYYFLMSMPHNDILKDQSNVRNSKNPVFTFVGSEKSIKEIKENASKYFLESVSKKMGWKKISENIIPYLNFDAPFSEDNIAKGRLEMLEKRGLDEKLKSQY